MTDIATSRQIDGVSIAAMFERTIDNDLEIIRQQASERYPNLPLRQPVLVSFVNPDDPPSMKYTQLKQAKAAAHSIDFKIVYLTPETTLEDVKSLLQKFNQAGTVDGIMFQLPIRPSLVQHQDELLSSIHPDKDVDGLTEAGRDYYRPATVEAVWQILQTQNTDVSDQVVAVAGSEGAIGHAIVDELQKHHPKQIIKVDQKLPGTSFKDLKDADIVFACLPSSVQIPASDLKSGVIAYDIGLGNFNSDVYQIASSYTPVQGGVGPNTVIALLRNLIKAYSLHLKSAYGLS